MSYTDAFEMRVMSKCHGSIFFCYSICQDMDHFVCMHGNTKGGKMIEVQCETKRFKDKEVCVHEGAVSSQIGRLQLDNCQADSAQAAAAKCLLKCVLSGKESRRFIFVWPVLIGPTAAHQPELILSTAKFRGRGQLAKFTVSTFISSCCVFYFESSEPGCWSAVDW